MNEAAGCNKGGHLIAEELDDSRVQALHCKFANPGHVGEAVGFVGIHLVG